MAISLKPVDVAVIGLGAAGGVAVLPLARAGLTIAGIEAGGWMDPHSFRPDEIGNNVRGMVTSVPKAKREIPTIRQSPSSPTQRIANHPMMNAVGGTSIHYWAQSWRLKPWDFRTRSEAIKRYGQASIPAGSTLEDWPVTYDELEPYYDLIEYEIGVSGKAGNLQGKIDPAGNIFEAPRKREYPMPPLRGTEFSERMADAARKLGWHPFQAPAAINSQPYRGRPGCVYHGYCNRGGCHIGAKGSTAITTIPEAVKTKNLTIFDYAQVTRIVAGADGRITGVSYIKSGKEYFQPARAVLLASYTYENSRLLLLSKSKAYPKGLSNNHGQVGRHYFGHWAGFVTGRFPFDINNWYGLPAQGATVDDWADDHYDHAGLGFIGGTTLHVHTETHPIDAASIDTFGQAPAWGSRWKSFIRENACRWTSAYLQTSTFPYETTFLDLDSEVRDPLGDPVCRITTAPRQNEQRAVGFANRKMEEWFRAAGAIDVFAPPANGPAISTHAYGGTRMGANSETNVVDGWGFSYEAPNLGILGASVMGTSGARNPTLTVQALAWRSAERLVKNWKSIAG
ncbi:MAG TPA: GMC family oxidoreductase [Bryobacteraceae bacterium]|nr:GMC family oxidoreductase [Bryobacteraceae bacterium]